MKKITLSIRVNHLLFILLFLPSIFLVSSFISGNSEEEVSSSQITIADANAFYNNNKGSLNPFGDGNEAFSISNGIFDALKTVNRKGPNAGFRLYFGKNNVGQNVSMIVGIDGQGKDITSYIEMSSDVSFYSSCPTICDMSSPIVSDN